MAKMSRIEVTIPLGGDEEQFFDEAYMGGNPITVTIGKLSGEFYVVETVNLVDMGECPQVFYTLQGPFSAALSEAIKELSDAQ